MDGWPTPEDAALESMPRGITHVVTTRYKAGGEVACVLLAIEARPPGYYLDENLCERQAGGGWWGTASAGGGFTDRTLEDLRADPPPQGLYDGFDRGEWE
jgi:hypothetical protein